MKLTRLQRGALTNLLEQHQRGISTARFIRRRIPGWLFMVGLGVAMYLILPPVEFSGGEFWLGLCVGGIFFEILRFQYGCYRWPIEEAIIDWQYVRELTDGDEA